MVWGALAIGAPMTTTHERMEMAHALRVKLKLSLELNHEPLGLYGVERKLIMVKGSGESMQHVMMKLLSYVTFYHEDLLIEAKAGQHYKPDLVRFDLTGEPVQWVDCGATTLKKLDIISRKNAETYIDIVKKSRSELALYKIQADARLARPERVRYWTFGRSFLNTLCGLMTGKHTLHVTVSHEYSGLFVMVDGKETLSTEIIRL